MPITYLDEEPQATKRKITYLDEPTVNEQSKPINKSNPSVNDSLGRFIYREALAPWVHGSSTLAAGIPKAVAKQTGAKDIIYPEQVTIPGKINRGVAEAVGFTAGLPGQVAKLTARGVGTLGSKLAPKLAKSALMRMTQGAVAGAASGATAGDTLQNRKNQAITGGILGGVLPGVAPAAKGLFRKIGKAASVLSGVEKEAYEETAKKGFRKVISEKYLNKKMPEQIQARIEQNLDDLQVAAGNKFDDLTTPLQKQPFDMAKFRGEIVKIAEKQKNNPFTSETTQTNTRLLDGIINKAEVNNLGDALKLRRFLDEEIYSANGELKSKFGKQIRDVLQKELHKNEGLQQADNEWTALMSALREARKVTGETGEKFLERFGKMTAKQKAQLVNLEHEIGGEPFVEDLSNYSLAKEFGTKKISGGQDIVSGLMRFLTRPALRSYLRGGEKVTEGLGKFDKATIGKLLGE